MDAFPQSKYREFPRALAEQVRQEYPALWAKHGTGGNPPTAFTGDHAYMLWGLWLAGDTSPEVRDWALRRREAYATRHRSDFRKGGVIAAIKWGVVLPIGVPAMMAELEQARTRSNAISKLRYQGLPGEKRQRIPASYELRKKVLSQAIGEIGPYVIWLVHGHAIRDLIDIDFTNGGNPEVYGYIPENEIWVEDTRGPRKDVACTLLHEVVETVFMQDGATYNDAHEHASMIEDNARRHAPATLKDADIIPWVRRQLATLGT